MNHSTRSLIILALVAATIMFFIASALDANYLFAAVGMTALLIVLTPMLARNELDWFSPWSFVVLSVALGCAARGICISFGWPDPDHIDFLFLLREEVSFFLFPWFMLLLGLLALTIGYFGTVPRWRPEVPGRGMGNTPGRGEVPAQRLSFNDTRLQLVLLFIVILSVGATLQYIQNTGGLSSGILSAKRTLIFDVDVGGDAGFNQYGHLRQVAKLANFAYLILLGHSLYFSPRISPLRAGILFLLFLVACALPFYSSSRLPIVWTFCGTGALLWYSGKPFNFRRIAIVGLCGAVAYLGMSILRGKSNAEHLIGQAGIESVVNNFVIHRNFLGLSKTAHVINAVPEVLDYQYGRTIGVWALAPIPRALWRDKPLIHSGPIIGTRVYGTTISGIPPGLIAELYWNFHIPGVLIGCYFVGVGLRWIDALVRPRRGGDLARALVYIIGPMRLGFELSGNSLGFAAMVVLIDVLTLSAILLLIMDRRATRTALEPRSVPQAFVPRRAIMPRKGT